MRMERFTNHPRLTCFDLNLLVALDALLVERNVTRAAQKLFVTQQAMSASLGRLRAHFNDELLVRVGREMVPTPLGISLTGPVREALLVAERVLATEPNFDPATAERKFRIAFSDYASFVILPQLLKRVTSVAPGIVIEMEPLSPTVLSRIEHGEIACSVTTNDLASFGGPRPGEALNMDPLFSDDFVCVADAGQPLLAEGLTQALYEQMLHNLARFGRPTESLVEKAWRQHDIHPRVGAVAPGFVALLFNLPGTPLIGTVPRRLADALAPTLGLRIHESPIPISSLNEVLIWHERDRMDPAHAFVRGLCQEAAAQIEGSPAAQAC